MMISERKCLDGSHMKTTECQSEPPISRPRIKPGSPEREVRVL